MKWHQHKKQALNRAPTPARASVWRGRLVLGLLVLGFVGLAARSFYLQVINNEWLNKKGEQRFVRVLDVPATRGRVLDWNGELLAISTPVKSIWAIPADVEADAKTLARLADLLELTVRDLRNKLSDTDRDFVYLKRQVAPDVAERIAALRVPGVWQSSEYRRFYPGGEVMAHVLGFTDVDDVGREGIELAFEKSLAGRPGKRRVIKDRLGQVVEDRERLEAAQDGTDLRISIDSRVQNLAFRHLKEAVAKHRAKGGGIVVLDTRTGELLALANLPTYNPNNRATITPAQTRNRAVTDNFEPGSTLKPFTIALALDLGKVKPTTLIATAPGSYTIQSATIRDAHPGGNLTVAEVIQKSSNVGSAKIALEHLTKEAMWRLFTSVGFGYVPHLGFPGETPGRVRPAKSWLPIEQATMSYGHGIATSLVQLARAYSIFARDGDLVPISLVRRERAVEGAPVISARTAEEVRKMLESVVSPQGTAPRAQIMGYRVAGKTGTAHKLEDGGYARDLYISSFVGFAPVSRPRLIVAVMIDEPHAGQYYGGAVAAPVFANVMQDALRILGVPYDAAVKPIELPPPAAEIRESL